MNVFKKILRVTIVKNDVKEHLQEATSVLLAALGTKLCNSYISFVAVSGVGEDIRNFVLPGMQTVRRSEIRKLL